MLASPLKLLGGPGPPPGPPSSYAYAVEKVQAEPGIMAQSVARLTEESEVLGVRYPVRPHTFVEVEPEIFFTADFPPFTDSRRAVVSYWQKYG